MVTQVAIEHDVTWIEPVTGVRLPKVAYHDKAKQVLTHEVLSLVAELHRMMQQDRKSLLSSRIERQRQFDGGQVPDYLDKESEMVSGDWKVAPIPEDLKCRRVEITGPVNSTKMVINMLSRNSEGYRADCAMLDFEDSMKPSWTNVIDGIHNVIGAAKGTLSYTDPKSGKSYAIDPEDEGTVMVRVRGLHLEESNILVDDEPIAGGILDLAASFYHTAQVLIDRGRTPKFYVPKVEHHLEARWWNTLFSKLEKRLRFPVPTLRATFLIETLPAAFQIEEILYELREHAAGLNVGRWDKIFSDIKTLRYHEDRVMADRSWINMERPWMRNYAQRLIQICHNRGAFALGGMAAHTPGKEPEKREEQAAKVLADKRWEFEQGHDGCWVSHPYFIGWAMRAFPRENQLDVQPDISTKFLDLLPTNEGPKTLEGLRTNVRVGIAYMAGWLQDIGCIAWDDLMEDLATLEISRASIWQWLHHKVQLDDGTQVDKALVARLFEEELERIFDELGEQVDRELWVRAKTEAFDLFTQETFQEFLSFKSDLVA